MPRRKPVSALILRERLDALVATFDISTIEPDPLQVVLRYDEPRDQEIIGLLAAAFAYGRASVVVANVGAVAARMKPSPQAYLLAFDRAEALKRFTGFSHRFHKTRDLVDLLEVIAIALREHGSLATLFENGYDASDSDIGPSLTRFVQALLAGSGRRPSRQLEYLLSSPANGSACKRLNLFLRWMVRRTPPDLGIWSFVDPAKLVMPVDTHIHRIATFLGLNRRRSADWKAAREITDRLGEFDPSDPVRYDFALCRLGILDLCSRKRREENCSVCLLRDACGFPVAKSNRLDRPLP
jgi:uncharacterized protein (TIGR02757 family)